MWSSVVLSARGHHGIRTAATEMSMSSVGSAALQLCIPLNDVETRSPFLSFDVMRPPRGMMKLVSHGI